MSILVVENDSAWLTKFKQLLPGSLGETATLQVRDSYEELIKPESLEHLRTAQLALVDLELGAGADGALADLDGMDKVLPVIRREAPWVPAVLITRYITGAPVILATVSPSDFDAVLPKQFFGDPATNEERWKRFRRAVALRRIASMTGRSLMEIHDCMEQKLELSYGRVVESTLERYGVTLVKEAVQLLGLGATRIVLDSLVLGFSGLSVLKATCSGPGFRTRWLLKCGTRIPKLHREAQAHRLMFVEGLTRQFSVPLFRHAPVVWQGFGIIAYEFEGDAQTLLEYALDAGVEAALNKVSTSLRGFYQEGHIDSIIPQHYLRPILVPGTEATGPGPLKEMLDDLSETTGNSFSDRSIEIRVSCQHGDCHARNILVGSHGAVLIDFANYVSRADRGIPLIDLAKLATDLTAFADTPWSFGDLVTGNALDGPLGQLACNIGCLINTSPSPSEKQLFAWASIGYMTRYVTYPDVPVDRKTAIRSHLGMQAQ